MVLTKSELIASLQKEVRVLQHLITKIGSDEKEEVMLKGGHVSLVAGANAIKRLWPKLDTWLGKRST